MQPIQRSFVLIVALLSSLLCAKLPATAEQAELDHASIARQSLKTHIQAGYQRLYDSFAALEAAVSSGCEGGTGLMVLRKSFVEVVRAWGAIQHIDFGPVRFENRYERIWFWPDRKGVGQRQVANALKKRPLDYTSVETLAGKSIALQGLTALEQIFYGAASDAGRTDNQTAEFACAYAMSIAGNLKTIAGDVLSEWRANGEYGPLWLNAGPDNPAFLKSEETTFALIKAFTTGAERIRDVELARPLGLTSSRRILPGPFAKSKLTMVFVAARISGLRSLIIDTGLATEMMRTALADGDDQAENALKQLEFELKFVDQRADELSAIPDLLGDAPQRSDAVALGYPLKSVRELTQNVTGRLTNLPVGFNASDGD